MTKNAKGVLIAVLGVGLAGGLFAVFAAVIVGVGMIAAAGIEEEPSGKNKTPVARDADQGRRKSSSSTSGVNSKRSNAAESGGSIPAPLVGRWLKREGGGETDFTGKSRYRSHRLHLYEISADGGVKYTFDRETLTIIQCEVKERREARGTASAAGDTLVINLDQGKAAESNSCEGGETTEKETPAETRTLKFELKTEGERAELCLQEESGEVCYLKQ